MRLDGFNLSIADHRTLVFNQAMSLGVTLCIHGGLSTLQVRVPFAVGGPNRTGNVGTRLGVNLADASE